MNYRKGQFVICLFDGKRNGDVIMGRIESVRADGHVLLKSLIGDTEKPRVKRAEVLAKRNIVCSKADIDALLAVSATRKEIAAYAKGLRSGKLPEPVELVLSLATLPGSCCEARIGCEYVLLSKERALEAAMTLIEFAR